MNISAPSGSGRGEVPRTPQAQRAAIAAAAQSKRWGELVAALPVPAHLAAADGLTLKNGQLYIAERIHVVVDEQLRSGRLLRRRGAALCQSVSQLTGGSLNYLRAGALLVLPENPVPTCGVCRAQVKRIVEREEGKTK